MLKFSRRVYILSSIIVIVIITITLLLRPQDIKVDSARVVMGSLEITVEDEGKTQLKDIYQISAPVAGRVSRIEINAGDNVAADETVVAFFLPIEPDMLNLRSKKEASASVNAAEANVKMVDAELEFAETELMRAIPLEKKGTISQMNLDQKKLAVKTAKAKLAYSHANLKKSKAILGSAGTQKYNYASQSVVVNHTNSDTIKVLAPITGKVIRVFQESEAVVSAGAPLMEIGNPKDLEIIVDILSTDAVKIKPGNKVIIEQWGGKNTLEGRVRLVEPFGRTKISALGIEEQRVNIIIDLYSTYTEWQNLGHGYRVKTKIIVEEINNVIKAPLGSLFRKGDNWRAFIILNDRAVERLLTIGAMNMQDAQIMEGLVEGDNVILYPPNTLVDGSRVTTNN